MPTDLAPNPLHAANPSASLAPEEAFRADTVDNLDKLLADEAAAPEPGKTPEELEEEAAAKAKAEAEAKAKAEADAANPPAKTPEELAAEEKAKADAAATPAPAKTPEELAAEEKAKVDAAAAAKQDEYDKIALPPHTSPKANEAFTAVKERARKIETELTSKLSTAEKEKLELQAKVAELEQRKLPAEVETELAELRKFRQAADITKAPAIVAFDARVAKNNSFILAKLKDSGAVAADALKKIEEIGVAEVDWDTLLDKLPTTHRRLIQAKLDDNETVSVEKAEAVERAKEDSAGFFEQQTKQEREHTLKVAGSMLSEIPWAVERTIPATATAEEKAKIGAANTEARKFQAKLGELISTARTPEKFVELGICTLIAERKQDEVRTLRKQLEDSKTAVETATKDLNAKLATVTGERDVLQKKLEAIRRSENPRLELDPSVQPANRKPGSGGFDLRSGEEALDAAFKEIAAT